MDEKMIKWTNVPHCTHTPAVNGGFNIIVAQAISSFSLSLTAMASSTLPQLAHVVKFDTLSSAAMLKVTHKPNLNN
jgi:hypothetical protein